MARETASPNNHHDPATPLPRTNPKEVRTGSRRDIRTPAFTTALLTTDKSWKPPRHPSTGGRAGKCVDVPWEVIQPKKEGNRYASWLNRKGVRLTGCLPSPRRMTRTFPLRKHSRAAGGWGAAVQWGQTSSFSGLLHKVHRLNTAKPHAGKW